MVSQTSVPVGSFSVNSSLVPKFFAPLIVLNTSFFSLVVPNLSFFCFRG